jgi:sugar phosphate isomerase/epimerase
MPHMLPKSYKRFFPFQLATTSFIYPADYVSNVKRLAPFLDGIELLFLESASLPSASCIRKLGDLSREHGLSYNVHLPSDVSIGHPDPRRRTCDLEALLRAVELVGPLSPCTLTLHVPREKSTNTGQSSDAWRQSVYESLTRLTRAVDDPACISVETLDYPFEAMADIIEVFGLSICMDIGHLILHGHDLGGFIDRYASRITIIHLHGVENGRDHLPLDRLSQPADDAVLKLLGEYKGLVSLEVFSFDALVASLGWLEARLKI